jgi:hypothetical protein
MAQINQRHCSRIAQKLNNRPRKRLGFRTPKECYEINSKTQPVLHFKLDAKRLANLRCGSSPAPLRPATQDAYNSVGCASRGAPVEGSGRRHFPLG